MEKYTFLKLLGDKIVRLRSDKNWSQSDLARACEKDRQSIERLENGKVNPSVFYLKQVADALELPISELFKTE
ncbi:helix-turn-helix domain-containing protein [Spirosoma pomorum]